LKKSAGNVQYALDILFGEYQWYYNNL
jgi:hypothetical protein